MKFTSVFLAAASSFALVNGASSCVQDICSKQVFGATCGHPTKTARRSDCSSFFRAVVTPAPKTITKTTTITVSNTKKVTVTTRTTSVTKTVTTSTSTTTATSTKTRIVQRDVAEASFEKRYVEKARAVTQIPTKIPAYASSCAGSSAYASACSCLGVKRTTTTKATPTMTIWITSKVTPTVKATATTTKIVSKTAVKVQTTTTVKYVEPETGPIVRPTCENRNGFILGGSSCNCCWVVTRERSRPTLGDPAFIGRYENVNKQEDCARMCQDQSGGQCKAFEYIPGICKLWKDTTRPDDGSPKDISFGTILQGTCDVSKCGAGNSTPSNPEPQPETCENVRGFRAGTPACDCCWVSKDIVTHESDAAWMNYSTARTEEACARRCQGIGSPAINKRCKAYEWLPNNPPGTKCSLWAAYRTTEEAGKSADRSVKVIWNNSCNTQNCPLDPPECWRKLGFRVSESLLDICWFADWNMGRSTQDPGHINTTVDVYDEESCARACEMTEGCVSWQLVLDEASCSTFSDEAKGTESFSVVSGVKIVAVE